MTHPNIVFTPRQRIDQGNIASFTGPIPTKYSKYFFDFFFFFFFFFCILMRLDRSIMRRDRSLRRLDLIKIDSLKFKT